MSAISIGVDVGVLDPKREGGCEDGGGGGNSPGGELRETGRRDVYEALQAALHRGSCFTFDRADGATAPVLPTTLGLRIAGAGDLSLPFRESDVEAIKNKASKVNDKSCRRVYELGPKKVKIQNPSWTSALEKLVETVAYKLGVNPVFLTAELDALLYMEKGSVDRRFNENEGAGILGILLIQLPSKFTGGEISFRDEDPDGEEAIHTFDLGSGLHSQFACHYACFYSGVKCEFARLRSGNRVFLRYSLVHRGRSFPTATMVRGAMSPLKRSLRMLPPVDRIVMVPLAKEYEAANLKHDGVNTLSNHHRGMFEALKAAAGAGWNILIVNAEMKYTHFSGGYDTWSSTEASSISQIFDECGNDVSNTLKWLDEVVDFDPLSQFDDEGNGMILTDPLLAGPHILSDPDEDIGEHWGPCKAESSCIDSNNTDRYHYSDDLPSRETKKVFRATFLLTYCTNCETLLRCLGGTKGVAEVSQKVVAARDYDLLQSLLDVVETKEESKFDDSSCTMLLQLLTRSTNRNAKVEIRLTLANRILLGLSTSCEPSNELYDAILSFVDKLGHENLSESFTKLFSSRPRQDLRTFLRRTNFILELNGRIERRASLQKSISTGLACSMDQLVWICISNLAQHRNPYISADINHTIYSMIDQHGWQKMEGIVDASLSCLNSSRSTRIRDLKVRTTLLCKLESDGRLSACHLKGFAPGLVAGLKSNGHQTISSSFSGQDKRLLVRGINWSLQYGDIKARSDLGSWATNSREKLHVLLNPIAELPFARKAALMLLNRSLVHHSVSRWQYHGWRNDKKEDGSVSPSIHVLEVLDKFPGLAMTTDSRGRIPLHHAAASASSSFEVVMEIFEANPKGASAKDPLTGLYPFMIAAAAGKVSASFSLLLADPNLVFGCSQDSGTKKRKRTNPNDASVVNNLVRDGGNSNQSFGDCRRHSMLLPLLDGEYDVKIPVTPFGLLLNVGEVRDSVAFLKYRKKPDGSKGPAELCQMIQRRGDIMITVNGRNIIGMAFKDVIRLLGSKGSYAYLRMAHRCDGLRRG